MLEVAVPLEECVPCPAEGTSRVLLELQDKRSTFHILPIEIQMCAPATREYRCILCQPSTAGSSLPVSSTARPGRWCHPGRSPGVVRRSQSLEGQAEAGVAQKLNILLHEVYTNTTPNLF